MIHASKLNRDFSYKAAENYLLSCPYNQWIEFKSILEFMDFQVIKLLDENFLKQTKVYFSDDCKKFKLTHNEN